MKEKNRCISKHIAAWSIVFSTLPLLVLISCLVFVCVLASNLILKKFTCMQLKESLETLNIQSNLDCGIQNDLTSSWWGIPMRILRDAKSIVRVPPGRANCSEGPLFLGLPRSNTRLRSLRPKPNMYRPEVVALNCYGCNILLATLVCHFRIHPCSATTLVPYALPRIRSITLGPNT